MTITAKTIILTDFGEFNVSYHEIDGVELVSFAHGDISSGRPMVRIQSACLFGQSMGSWHCDCGGQLKSALSQIYAGNGVVLFSPRGEGRGAGLSNKIRAMELERRTNCSNTEAFRELGLPSVDLREFKVETWALRELGVSKRIRLPTANEKKRLAVLAAGFELVD